MGRTSSTAAFLPEKRRGDVDWGQLERMGCERVGARSLPAAAISVYVIAMLGRFLPPLSARR